MSEPTINTDQDNSLSSSSKDLLLPETMVEQVNSTSENILQPKMENHTVDDIVLPTGIDTGGEFRFVMDGGDAGMVRKLLEQGASANTKTESDNYRPLHYALIKRREDYVEALVQHGAATNARDENGRLPLLLASRLGLAKSVGLLLDHGARPFQPLTPAKWSSLHVAAHNGNKDCVAMILEKVPSLLNVTSAKSSMNTPLHVATSAGHVNIVDQLLLAGAKVNERNKPVGHTPLHIAARLGLTEICAMLLDAGANPILSERGATKRNALAIARDYKNNDCITLLLLATNDAMVDDDHDWIGD
jgi:ankyrin repeat protein